MPARRKACATLCFYLGSSGTEAARISGIEASTVRLSFTGLEPTFLVSWVGSSRLWRMSLLPSVAGAR